MFSKQWPRKTINVNPSLALLACAAAADTKFSDTTRLVLYKIVLPIFHSVLQSIWHPADMYAGVESNAQHGVDTPQ